MSDRKAALRKLPKVELHRHLDGSVRLDTILELSAQANIDLGIGDLDREQQRAHLKVLSPMKDLATVLNVFWNTQKVMHSYEAMRRIAFENVEDCFRDGIKLAELRFAPTFISQGKSLQNDEIIEGILDGISEGMERYDIQVGLIGILPRGLDFDKNVEATKDLIRYRNSSHRNHDRLIGFDLADAELCAPFSKFTPLINQAREAGFGITIHSGEDTSAQAVIDTIEAYRPSRIGHGIKIFGNADATDLVKAQGIHLEVCPISNWLTQSVKTLEEHPIGDLYRSGVSLGLNSDDPHIMNIDLVDEYVNAEAQYGFSAEDFKRMNQAAAQASFLNDDIIRRVQDKHLA